MLQLIQTAVKSRENKILKRYMATPIKPMDILTSQLVVKLVMIVLSITALSLFGKFAYGVRLPDNMLPVILALFITALCIFSLGLLITSISSGIRASNVLSLLIYFPMLFLSGAIMPLDAMPESMSRIGGILPLAFGIDLLKGVWCGHTTDIFTLLIIFLVCTIGSALLFRWE